MAACPNAGLPPVPLQLGVGVGSGNRNIGLAIAAEITANPQFVTVRLDWRSAFISLSRAGVCLAQDCRMPHPHWCGVRCGNSQAVR